MTRALCRSYCSAYIASRDTATPSCFFLSLQFCRFLLTARSPFRNSLSLPSLKDDAFPYYFLRLLPFHPPERRASDSTRDNERGNFPSVYAGYKGGSAKQWTRKEPIDLKSGAWKLKKKRKRKRKRNAEIAGDPFFRDADATTTFPPILLVGVPLQRQGRTGRKTPGQKIPAGKKNTSVKARRILPKLARQEESPFLHPVWCCL